MNTFLKKEKKSKHGKIWLNQLQFRPDGDAAMIMTRMGISYFEKSSDDEYGSIFLLSIFQNMLFPMQLSQQPLEEDLQLRTVTNSEPSNIS